MAGYVYRTRRPIRDMRADTGPRHAWVESSEPLPTFPPIADEPVAVDYAAMLKAELIELAESLGIDADGTKAEIIERLPHG